MCFHPYYSQTFEATPWCESHSGGWSRDDGCNRDGKVMGVDFWRSYTDQLWYAKLFVLIYIFVLMYMYFDILIIRSHCYHHYLDLDLQLHDHVLWTSFNDLSRPRHKWMSIGEKSKTRSISFGSRSIMVLPESWYLYKNDHMHMWVLIYYILMLCLKVCIDSRDVKM